MVQAFWKWSGISPEKYAENAINLKLIKGEDEFDYPYFFELIRYGKNIIKQNTISEQQMDELLTIMALDNENEDILDYAVDNINLANLDYFVHKGVVHLQPHARWQVAEFIRRKNLVCFQDYLEKLSRDPNDYVRKRAKNAMNLLTGK